MMWVILPTGERRQYNNARYATRSGSYTDLYDRKDGNWIAQVPNTWMIEQAPPYLVEAPRAAAPHLDQVADVLRRSVSRAVSNSLRKRRRSKK